LTLFVLHQGPPPFTDPETLILGDDLNFSGTIDLTNTIPDFDGRNFASGSVSYFAVERTPYLGAVYLFGALAPYLGPHSISMSASER